MTDKEYSRLVKLTQIRTTLTLIREIVPDDEIIKKEEMQEIEGKLMDWRDELQKKIKTQ